jgi:hypothetical protein
MDLRRFDGTSSVSCGDHVWEEADWINLAQARDRWRVLVNTVMNLRVPQNAGNFLNS